MGKSELDNRSKKKDKVDQTQTKIFSFFQSKPSRQLFTIVSEKKKDNGNTNTCEEKGPISEGLFERENLNIKNNKPDQDLDKENGTFDVATIGARLQKKSCSKLKHTVLPDKSDSLFSAILCDASSPECTVSDVIPETPTSPLQLADSRQKKSRESEYKYTPICKRFIKRKVNESSERKRPFEEKSISSCCKRINVKETDENSEILFDVNNFLEDITSLDVSIHDIGRENYFPGIHDNLESIKNNRKSNSDTEKNNLKWRGNCGTVALDCSSKIPPSKMNNSSNRISPPDQQEQNKESVNNINMKRISSANLTLLREMCRHTVLNVERSEREIILILWNSEKKIERTCHLKGFWAETQVEENDIVHVLADFSSTNVAVIDDNNGLLVVNPDYLISSTAIVGAVFCMRKAILSEKFKGLDPGNRFMVIGSIIHEIFGKALIEKKYEMEELKSIAEVLLSQPQVLLQLYSYGESEESIREDIFKYLPEMKTWFELYLNMPSKKLYPVGKLLKNSRKKIEITEIDDIEENIWSPHLGIKGKIDVTAQVKIHSQHSTIKTMLPLELKTGKLSYSVEHEGQVMLYNMMLNISGKACKDALLLYLQNAAQMKLIEENHNSKRGLIQLRNKIVNLLCQSISKNSAGCSLPPLPEPIDNCRGCQKCAYLIPCTIYSKNMKKVTELSEERNNLSLTSISHLTELHMDYFLRCCLFLELESNAKKQYFCQKLWMESSETREKIGLAFQKMALSGCSEITEDGKYKTFFTRHPDYASQDLPSLIKVGLSAKDMIVVSLEDSNQIAISLGKITSIDDKYLETHLDRNLYRKDEWRNAVFRLDRYEASGPSAANFVFLSNLMANTPSTAKLRSLVIDKHPPAFMDRLKKEVIMKGRSILKCLNLSQLQTVFKVLMAKDYLLIKGLPGTGKTFTIVQLVCVLLTLGYTVLLASYTHSAVDNILLKLKLKNIDFLRLGNVSSIHSDIVNYSLEHLLKSLKTVKQIEEAFKTKALVATTCFSTTHFLLQKRRFDYCIVDEASQISPVTCLGPLLHADKFVLVGDTHQLPPLIQSSETKLLGMDKSLFEYLESDSSVMQLTQQYRMNQTIMNLANSFMYQGQLQCGSEKVANSTLFLPQEHLMTGITLNEWLIPVLSCELNKSVIFLSTDKLTVNSAGVKNETEAAVVFKICRVLLKVGISAESIGIIAPYCNQVTLIKHGLPNETKIEVNTVDQYQGRDKEIIIISCVHSSNTSDLASSILQDERRLNVAITRAKRKLIIIGSLQSLMNFHPFKKLLSLLEQEQIFNLQSI